MAMAREIEDGVINGLVWGLSSSFLQHRRLSYTGMICCCVDEIAMLYIGI